MAKNKPKSAALTKQEPANSSNSGFSIQPKHWPYIALFVISFLAYSNSLFNQYAIDDAIVLTENTFVKKGFAGIKEIFTHDAFVGFFGERGSTLIQGGRYRPLSIAIFAVEYELWELNPFYSHTVNVILFALSSVLIFYFLSLLAKKQEHTKFYLSFPFIATLLYVLHPIHTEAVANIKGRDEIIAMLLSIATAIAAIKYVKENNIKYLVLSGVLFFLALLSKENTITFIAIIPLCFYFFTTATKQQYIYTIAMHVVLLAIFLVIRSKYAPTGILQESTEVLNNPFALATTGQRYATIVFTWLLYIKLMILPWPLSHDYYYNQIPYETFSSIGTILSIIINVGLFIFAITQIKNKSWLSFGLLFYFITFSIVSNLLFTVGVLLNERFIYMPSLGFCIILAYFITQLIESKKLNAQTTSYILAFIAVLYFGKTFSRNYAWKDNFTLIETDAVSSPNSSKVRTSHGGELIAKSDTEQDTTKRRIMLDLAISELKAGLAIYPKNGDAWLLMGNAVYKRGRKADEAIDAYAKAFEYKGRGSFDALYNTAVVQLENNRPQQAKENLLKAAALKPNQYKCYFNIGEAYARINKPDSAIMWFNGAAQLMPDDAAAYHKVGVTYGKQMNKIDEALPWLTKALQLQPNNPIYLEDYAVATGMKGNFDESIKAASALLQQKPDYANGYMILSTSLRNKGDIQKADEMQQRAMQLANGQKK